MRCILSVACGFLHADKRESIVVTGDGRHVLFRLVLPRLGAHPPSPCLLIHSCRSMSELSCLNTTQVTEVPGGVVGARFRVAQWAQGSGWVVGDLCGTLGSRATKHIDNSTIRHDGITLLQRNLVNAAVTLNPVATHAAHTTHMHPRQSQSRTGKWRWSEEASPSI